MTDAAPAPAARILGIVRDRVAPCCAAAALHVRDEALPARIIAEGGFDTTLLAALSLWVQRIEEIEPLRVVFNQISERWSAYSVVESVIREYPRVDWPVGTKSPGATLFALIRRSARVRTGEFFRLWQEHSQLSMRLHPLTRYHRNAVQRQLDADQADCDGIIEERVGSMADLAPERFYMGAGAMEAAVKSLSAYVDLEAGGLACALLEEYLIKLPPWLESARSGQVNGPD